MKKRSDSSSSAGSSTGTDNSEDQELMLFDHSQGTGWKTVFLLQFQSQFEAVIMIGIYISYICSLIDIAFAYSTDYNNIPRSYTASGLGKFC